MNINCLILAQKKNDKTNFKTPLPLIRLCGKALIDYALETADKIGNGETIIVSDDVESLKTHAKSRASFFKAFSFEIKELLKNDGTVAVFDGFFPLIKSETILAALTSHISENRAATIIAKGEQNENAGIFLFDQKKLLLAADELGEDCSFSEIIKHFSLMGEKIGNAHCDYQESERVIDSITHSKIGKILYRQNAERAQSAGAFIIDPDTVYISSNVKIGRDTIIYPNTILEGETEIGEDCKIGPDTEITDSKIGDNSTVQKSVILNSEVGDFVNIGPFAYLRPNSKIGNNIKIGDFVEIKNASIDDGTKVAHLTYVGDAFVGKNVNFGCGTVVVNYDGKNKHKTTIGNDVFIGCNTNLVSPVTIGDGAFTAAGSTITDAVPKDALAIARARQTNKENWTKPKDRK